MRAASIGRKSIDRNVVTIATRDIHPARQIDKISGGRSVRTPARMSSAPSAGMTIGDTTWGNPITIRAAKPETMSRIF